MLSYISALAVKNKWTLSTDLSRLWLNQSIHHRDQRCCCHSTNIIIQIPQAFCNGRENPRQQLCDQILRVSKVWRSNTGKTLQHESHFKSQPIRKWDFFTCLTARTYLMPSRPPCRTSHWSSVSSLSRMSTVMATPLFAMCFKATPRVCAHVSLTGATTWKVREVLQE